MSRELLLLCISLLFYNLSDSHGRKVPNSDVKHLFCIFFLLGLNEVEVNSFLHLLCFCTALPDLCHPDFCCLKCGRILRLETKQHILKMSIYIFELPHPNVPVKGIATLHRFSWV